MSSSGSAEATPPSWLELPREITAAIFNKLGTVEILTTAQKVCPTWRRVCQDPSMWRCIDIRGVDANWETPPDFDKMCRRAVDLSSGQLVDINIEDFGTDDLLLYISERSSKLKRLQLANCGITDDGLRKAIKNFPLLEELHLYYTRIGPETIETIGRCCPLLKSFKLNHQWEAYTVSDDLVLQIAENMSGLCHLQLIENVMTCEGLKAVLEGCPNLESLDIRRCFNVRLSGDLRRSCSERIKDFKLPNDSTRDYEFRVESCDYDSSDDSRVESCDYDSSDDDYCGCCMDYEDNPESSGDDFDMDDSDYGDEGPY